MSTASSAMHDETGMVEKSSIFNKDDALLAEMGYKSELKRHFSILQVFGMTFNIMSLLPSIASTMSFSLLAGAAGMTWGWFTASFFIMTVGISMAEMGSAMPTSGGLYWWTYKFSPEKVKRPFSFLCGYSNSMGMIGGLCSIDYGFATFVMAVATIATDGAFIATKYQLYGVFVGTVLSHCLVGTMATRYISKLQIFGIVANIVIVLVTIIALPIGKKDDLNSGEYVFSNITNSTGWPNGWAWFLSWLSPIFTIGAFDSAVHMAEEAAHASIAVPLGILGSISICSVLGFVLMAVFAACLNTDDYQLNLDLVTGQPMAYMFRQSLGKRWAIGMMTMIFIVQWFMGLFVLIAGSRQVWAFSRDGALPFSKLLRVVNYRLGVPIRAVWFMCVIAILLGLLTLVDSAAQLALFSLANSSNALAWLLPIASRAFFSTDNFKPGPFYIGGVTSRIISMIASFYLIFVITIISTWPTSGPNPTPTEMNYNIVFNGAVWIGALAYYYLDAHKWFVGPQSTFDAFDIDVVLDNDMDEEIAPTTIRPEEYELR